MEPAFRGIQNYSGINECCSGGGRHKCLFKDLVSGILLGRADQKEQQAGVSLAHYINLVGGSVEELGLYSEGKGHNG